MLYKGKVHTVGDHIDTDAIIPAKFLVTGDPEALGKNCMEGLEEGWNKRLAQGDFIVAGKNFGCGSSREHAPVAIIAAGVPVVIAHSFARIFYRNSFNMGLMLVEVGDDYSEFKDGAELELDTAKGVLKNLSTNKEYSIPVLPKAMQDLLDKQGLINYVSEKLKNK